MAQHQEPEEGELVSSASKEGVPKLVNRRESEIGRDKRASANRAEAEEAIKRIASHRGIIGTVITNNDAIPIRSSMDKEGTQQYAAFVTPLAQRAKMITLNHDPKCEVLWWFLRTAPLVVSMWPCKRKLDEEESKHACLAQQNGFGPVFLHRLVKCTAKLNTYC